MLGLPYEMPNEDFPLFIEPFLQQLVGYSIIIEELDSPHLQDLSGKDIESVKQCKKFAILAFDSYSSKEVFVDYYNNIQVPLFSEIAPCIVVALNHIDVRLSDSEVHCPLLMEMMKHNSSSVSFHSPVNVSGRTSRCMSSPQTVPKSHSPPLSASRTRLDSLDQTSSSSTNHAVVKMLPTCVVCLRRICNIGTYIPGAGALKICRSYTYDNNNIAVMRCGTPASGGAGPSASAVSPFNNISSGGSSRRTPNHIDGHSGGGGMVEFIRCFACAAYNSISESKYTHPNTSTSSGKMSGSSSSSTSSATSSFSALCMDCGLSDGVWLCMICCHTGCGRYKSRHAQQHFQSSGHSLSLELASGLIWDYLSDAYVHVDDVSSPHVAAASASSGGGSLQRQSSFGAVSSTNSAASAAADAEWSEASSSSSSVFQSITSPGGAHSRSFLMGTRVTSHQGGDGNVTKHRLGAGGGSVGFVGSGEANSFGKSSERRQYFTINSEDVPMLDSVTVDKMNHLIGNYESLLQSQLSDQEMYYEKMLARETVRALELTYHKGADAAGTAASSGGKAAKKRAQQQQQQQQLQQNQNQHASGAEFKSDDATLLTEDLVLGEEECDLRDIESMKIDISSVEAEYRRVLEEIKGVEEETRVIKKKNDALIKCQKALKEKEADYLLKEESFKQKCALELADLEQQIRDLTFYVKTRKQMQVSPMKEELMEGSVITVPQTNHQKGSNSSNKNSKKTKK